MQEKTAINSQTLSTLSLKPGISNERNIIMVRVKAILIKYLFLIDTEGKNIMSLE